MSGACFACAVRQFSPSRTEKKRVQENAIFNDNTPPSSSSVSIIYSVTGSTYFFLVFGGDVFHNIEYSLSMIIDNPGLQDNLHARNFSAIVSIV